MQKCYGGDDRSGERAVRHERERTFVGVLALRDHDRREEVADHDQRADGEQDHAKVERWLRAQRNVRSEEHVRLPGPHRPVHEQRAAGHQGERDPAERGRGQPRGEQRRCGEIEHRHLEEQHEENQHVHAVNRQHAVEPDRVQQVHRLPAREQHEQRRDAADQERDRRRDGVRLDQRIRLRVNAEPSGGTATHCGGHRAAPVAAPFGTTITLPTIR